MKILKQFLHCLIAALLIFSVNASAQTCYDPNYGYYDCSDEDTYYPDQGDAFVEGAFFGMILGGIAGDDYGRHHHEHGGGGEWHGGGHGGGGHGGGGHGGHH